MSGSEPESFATRGIETVIRWLYTFCLACIFPFFLVWFLFQMVLKNKYRRGFSQRLGMISVDRNMTGEMRRAIWVHAASVGEVRVAEPVVKGLCDSANDLRVYVTCITDTGYETAKTVFPNAEGVYQAPFDFPFAVNRYMDALTPDLLILIETEIWPNLIHAADRRRIPVMLVNGRISDTSYPRYRMIRSVLRPTLRKISLAAMQSERDARRLVELGANPDKTKVAGNVKYDRNFDLTPSESLTALYASAGWTDMTPVLVAGSTHSEDETALLTAYDILKNRHGMALHMIIAPRHLERTHELTKQLTVRGISFVRRSEYHGSSGDHIELSDYSEPEQLKEIIVLDVVGELTGAYGLGIIGCVGGTFQDIGGHNLLEPAAHGIPVLFGPHIQNCREPARALMNAGGGFMAEDGNALAERIAYLLRDGDVRVSAGRRAREVISMNRGAVSRNVDYINQLMNPESGGAGTADETWKPEER